MTFAHPSKEGRVTYRAEVRIDRKGAMIRKC